MSDCIEWTGATNGTGYGKTKVKIDGRWRFFSVHRRAWELMRGPIPDGMLVCHTCDNPICFNVEHLFLGTHKDNSHDMARKHRNRSGSDHHNSKINEEIAHEIRVAYRLGAITQKLADLFGVAGSNISQIVSGRRWVSKW